MLYDLLTVWTIILSQKKQSNDPTKKVIYTKEVKLSALSQVNKTLLRMIPT